MGLEFAIEYSRQHCLDIYGADVGELNSALDDRAAAHRMDSVLESMKLL